MFVAAMLLGFLVHGMLLHGAYAKLVPEVFRAPDDAQHYFPYMLLAHLFIAIGFTWIYRAGRDNRPWVGQGLRFGLAVAVLTTIPTYLIYFAVQPLPSDLVAQQIVYDTISMVILGLVVAAVNRDPIPTRP
jgi:drug/metabolite transporter (DMT)-like permease